MCLQPQNQHSEHTAVTCRCAERDKCESQDGSWGGTRCRSVPSRHAQGWGGRVLQDARAWGRSAGMGGAQLAPSSATCYRSPRASAPHLLFCEIKETGSTRMGGAERLPLRCDACVFVLTLSAMTSSVAGTGCGGRPLPWGPSRHSCAPRANFIWGAETPAEARLVLVHLQSGQKHTSVPERRTVGGLLPGWRKEEGPRLDPSAPRPQWSCLCSCGHFVPPTSA